MKNYLYFFSVLFFLSFHLSYSQNTNVTIDAGAYYFNPDPIEIEVGSTVTWMNVGGLHDVNGVTNTITGESFGNPEDFYLSPVYAMNADNPVEIGSYTFNVPGTYNYDCSIGNHAAQGMVGQIVVTYVSYPGCTNELACNYDINANEDDGSCIINEVCCAALTPSCLACQACLSPEQWCADQGWSYPGCDEYEILGCTDDGMQDWSPFPGNIADNFNPDANTEDGSCLYWGCGNPNNNLILIGTFMDEAEDGWDGASMTVLNVWDESEYYDVDEEVFYFTLTEQIGYTLPAPASVDTNGDGEINYLDCPECPLNPDYEGEWGYVVTFCAPDDLLDGCYNLIVDYPDDISTSEEISWQIQNAEFSVFALSGASGFDQTSGSACEGNEGESGFDFYDLDVVSVEYNEGVVNTVIANTGNESTPIGGYTWILVDGSSVLVDTPPSWTFGSSNEFSYDISDIVSQLDPGNHSLTVWVNGGEQEPLGAQYGWAEQDMDLYQYVFETFYGNNSMTIDFDVPFINGCTDPWAGNFDPSANTDDGSCDYSCNEPNQSSSVVVNSGENPNEIAWSIQTVDGEIILEALSGNASPYDSSSFSENGLCFSPGCYMLVMTDSYGDGWNGNELSMFGETYFIPSYDNGVYEGGNYQEVLFEIGDGFCSSYLGCTNELASNYDENAIQDDGSCTYDCSIFTDAQYESVSINVNGGSDQSEISWEIVNEDGNIVLSASSDDDNDLTDGAPYLSINCLEVGCYTVNMYDSANNGWNTNTITIDTDYDTWEFTITGSSGVDEFAVGDPSNCIGSFIYGCTDSNADNYNSEANVEDGSCIFYGCTDENAYNYNSQANTDNESCIYEGCTDVNSCNYESFASIDNGTCEYTSCLGCTDPLAINYDQGSSIDDGSCAYSCSEIGLSEVSIYMSTNGTVSGWYGSSLNIGDNSYILSGYTQTITSCLDLNQCLDVTAGGGIMQYFIGWSITYENEVILNGAAPFVGEIGNCDVLGCIDITACNYDSEADVDDGSCTYPSQTYLNCEGTCINDEDGDGVCDENEIIGCMDESAMNFDSSATDDDGCIYEILGCTDPSAANYNDMANTDDDSCDYGPWGEVASTDCNMTILLPGDADITIEGEPISNGDWVGVFYMNDATGEMVCGGSTIWTGETTSIAAWGAEGGDNGFESSETLTWGVYDSENQLFIIGANATYTFGAGFYTCNSQTGINSIEAVSTFSQSIPLTTGWGIWSTFIDPDDTNMTSIFSDIMNDLIIVKDEEGNVYWPMFGLNSIGSLTKGKGYQVKMESDATLEIEGNLVPYDFDINLDEGWGITGYLHQECYSAVDMMSSVVNNLTILKDEEGNVYWPMFGLNSIGNMCPGKGYQIKMENSTLLNYPSSGGARYGDVYIERPVHFDEPVNTGNNMIIGLPLNAWETTPSIGDEIAAYGEDGTLIGSTTFQGDHIALTIWGDDLTTNKKDGTVEGETISFKLWNSQTGIEQAIEVRWSQGVGFYTTDGISVAGQIILGSELTTEKQLVKITDVLGREVNGDEKDVMLLYIYDDGSIERVYTKE